jgi:hypothetical protein
MARGKKHTAEQIVSLLRQIEVGTANGKLTPQACKEAGITEQTYLAQRVWWSAGRSGAAAEGSGAGEGQAEAAGG